jgi:hypothetical protein
MTQTFTDDTNPIESVFTLCNVMKFDVGPKLFDRNREENTIHLSINQIPKGTFPLGRSIQSYTVTGDIEWSKKRQAVEMIPVRMGDENTAAESAPGGSHNIARKITQTGAGIKYKVSVSANLYADARSVASVLQ